MDGMMLLPSPRRVVQTGGAPVRAGEDLVATLARLLEAPVSTLRPGTSDGLTLRLDPGASGHEQGYRLRVAGTVVTVEARSEIGLRYGLLTLRQMLAAGDGALSSVLVEDEPGFARRGVMLDVSRDRVPTIDELRRVIDVLASLKFNHLQLYTEHTFAYAGHEAAWRGWSPITPGEARELDAYAASRGVELAANQNCFGHLSSWLRLPEYAHLAETHGVWKFMTFDRSGPFSLCPVDPASAAFVGDLLGQLLPCFSSGLVNIGCDETFDVGWGRSRGAVEERGKASVYFEFVNAVAEIARRHGKRPMLWADMALSHPESLGLMPPGSIGLVWGYEGDAPFGEGARRLREAGRAAWVCPGTSSWRSFTGRTSERRANIAGAAMQGSAGGAEGFLVCDWGDLGHRQTWPIALQAIAHGAAAAWNPGGAAGFDARSGAVHAFGESAELGAWLDELGDVDREIRLVGGRTPEGLPVPIRNASALFNDLHPPVPPKPGTRAVCADAAAFERVLERVEGLAGRMPRVVDNLVREELEHTLMCCRLAGRHAVSARSARPFADRAALIGLAKDVRAEHRRLWARRSRAGGLEHSCGHYDRVIAGLEAR